MDDAESRRQRVRNGWEMLYMLLVLSWLFACFLAVVATMGRI